MQSQVLEQFFFQKVVGQKLWILWDVDNDFCKDYSAGDMFSTFFFTMFSFLNQLWGIILLSPKICPNSMGEGSHTLLIWLNELYSDKSLG